MLESNMPENKEFYNGIEVAVIGISCKYPKSKNIKELWENLVNGVHAITDFSDDELLASGISPSLIDSEDFIKSKGFIDRAEYFDYNFFGYTAFEADSIEPQERLLYQVIWEAMEDSGYVINNYPGLIGLYTGSAFNLQWPLRNIVKNGEDARLDVNQFDDKDFTSTRISYRLNLKGPSMSIQTACSSGLTVLHTACRALVTGECDIALAATSSIKLPIKGGHLYQKGGLYSQDNSLRPFDENAIGIVEGDGIGVLVLKTLDAAIEDRDHIYAVVKGTSINNDGNRKVGYHSPSVKGQIDVIEDAFQVAEIEKNTINFIETHGTGTPLGDSIEIAALKRVFDGIGRNSIALGSSKSNFGHTGCSSGMLGLIKSILCINNKVLVPTINHKKASGILELDQSPFYVAVEKERMTQEQIIRGAVSSFGIGGTNGHAILEESPKYERDSKENIMNIFPLSAKSEVSLNEKINKIEEYFINENGFSDICYTLQKGREEFEYRYAVVSDSVDGVIHPVPQKVFKGKTDLDLTKNIAFMFGGQGTQYSNMGLELYQNEDNFKNIIDNCFDIVESIKGVQLREILYPHDSTINKEICDIEITPIITFIFEYALTKLIISKGVKVDVLIGHSLGEYVAACISGIFSLKDALQLVICRGELMSGLPDGKMLSVPLNRDEMSRYLSDKISLAADHGVSCTVSGKDSDVMELSAVLKKERIICQYLNIEKPGHSYLMDPILEQYRMKLRTITLNPLAIPIISSVTGDWLTNEQAMSVDYWVSQIRNTVQFSKGLMTIVDHGIKMFFEINTNNALSMILQQFRSENKNIFATVFTKFQNQKGSDLYCFYAGLIKYWCKGGTLNWDEFHNDHRFRVSLPTYAFNEKELPVDLKSVQEEFQNIINSEKNDNIKDWFYIPSWVNLEIDSLDIEILKDKKVLIFYYDNFLINEIKRQLDLMNVEINYVFANDEFDIDDNKIGINPEMDSHYTRLVDYLESINGIPDVILNFWNYQNYTEEKEIDERLQISMDLGYYTLINLIKAIENIINAKPISIIYITDKAQGNNYISPAFPEKIISGGIIKTAPLEFPSLNFKHIDINEKNDVAKLVSNILSVSFNVDIEHELLLENNKILTKKFSNIKVGNSNNFKPKEGGVYLITGGIGGIGLSLAKYLAKQSKCNILLLTRREVNRENRKEVLSTEEFEMINELEALLASIDMIKCDVGEEGGVKETLGLIYDKYGTIDGVIHAAGVFDGNIILENKKEDIYRLFNAKLYGCLYLNKYLNLECLDFMVYCSSLSSHLPSVGQVNYVAANMFLDNYAKHQAISDMLPVVSINWDTWKEVGGAVKNVKDINSKTNNLIVEKNDLDYPSLNGYIKSKISAVYHFDLDQKFWLINEHQVNGIPTLPGVVFIDWVIAGFRDFMNDNKALIHIEELIITAPIILEENQIEVKIIYEKQVDNYFFKIISGIENNDKGWYLNCQGIIKAIVNESKKESYDIDAVSKSCLSDTTDFALDLMKNGTTVKFGHRWISNFKKRFLGKDEALVLTEVNEMYAEEHKQFNFYPAQLDHCFGVLKAGYTPFAYYNIYVYGTASLQMYSHIKEKASNNVDNFSSYELNIVDVTNNELVMRVENYLLIKLPEELMTENNNMTLEHKEGTLLSKFLPRDIRNKDNENDLLKHGISCEEGAEVFSRSINESFPQVLISTRNLESLERILSEQTNKLNSNEGTELISQRPNLFTEYEAPNSKPEMELTQLLQEVLNIDKIGRYDNFFDLGMTSITLIKYVSKIKKKTGIDLQLVDVFNNSNVLNLSLFLYPENEEGEEEIKKEIASINQNILKRKKLLNNE